MSLGWLLNINMLLTCLSEIDWLTGWLQCQHLLAKYNTTPAALPKIRLQCDDEEDLLKKVSKL